MYEIVKNHTKPPDHIFQDSFVYTEICKIRSGVLGTPHDIHLYQRIKSNLGIHHEGASFARLTLFLKHKRLVTQSEYMNIEAIRRERNKIHVQSLQLPDISYTKAKVNKVSKTIYFLFSKV